MNRTKEHQLHENINLLEANAAARNIEKPKSLILSKGQDLYALESRQIIAKKSAPWDARILYLSTPLPLIENLRVQAQRLWSRRAHTIRCTN